MAQRLLGTGFRKPAVGDVGVHVPANITLLVGTAFWF
jgi:hypothetical protein